MVWVWLVAADGVGLVAAESSHFGNSGRPGAVLGRFQVHLILGRIRVGRFAAPLQWVVAMLSAKYCPNQG